MMPPIGLTMIVSWPARINSTGLRRQYVHAVDIVPTLCSMLGIELPEVVRGYPLTTQRNPMWLVVVSIASAWRAAGR